jgi:hypothetical protein
MVNVEQKDYRFSIFKVKKFFEINYPAWQATGDSAKVFAKNFKKKHKNEASCRI